MIDILWFLFDSLLVTVLLFLGWVICATRHIRRAVTLFCAFGLLLALVWARLRAPDLALAEAVIGAGISGALLLSAIKDYAQGKIVGDQPTLVVWSINLMTLCLALVMGWALWHGIEMSDGVRLTDVVMSTLDSSGVTNPVTAVLLNFRAYDTLLELAVVLTAVLTVLSLNPMRLGFQPAEPLLSGLLSWLVPLLIVTSGYLLWVGAHAPGGAFQAGALLATAFILLQLTNQSLSNTVNLYLLRWLLVIGILVFIVIGLLMMALNDSFLGYSAEWSGLLILTIESAATISIAMALTLAYFGGRPQHWENNSLPEKKSTVQEKLE
jgi:multisubunit Na+/H+ antiporter MnhB subunit